MLNWLLIGSPVVSSALSGLLVYWLTSRSRVDEFTAKKLRRELDQQDEERNRQRIEQDLARADALRKELAELTLRNNAQFDEIVETRQEVLELQQEVFELRQWATQVTALAVATPLPPVPAVRSQPHRFRGDDAGHHFGG